MDVVADADGNPDQDIRRFPNFEDKQEEVATHLGDSRTNYPSHTRLDLFSVLCSSPI